MRYLGNKSRLAKELAPILTTHLTGDNWYIEPFAGACGMISNIDYAKRIAYDNDKYIVAFMQSVRDGWTPKESVTDIEYYTVKNNPDRYSPEYVGFLGYGCSFGGKWFAGMARGGETSKGFKRNHVAESSRNLVKMRPKLQGMIIGVSNYRNAVQFDGSVVYCDPPYSTGTQYKNKFNHVAYWDWVRETSMKNYVYVSEYNAPDDFVTVWTKEYKSGIDNKAKIHKPTVEKLFVYKDGKVNEVGS